MARSQKQLAKARREDCPGDPYRSLEEDTPERAVWVNSQHEYALTQLSSLSERAAIKSRLETLMRVPGAGSVLIAGDRTFFRQRASDQQLSALYCKDSSATKPRLLIDPNKLTHEESVALADIHPSVKGTLLAYRLSRAGNSGMSLHVMDVDSGKNLADVIPGDVNPVAHVWHTKNQVAWLPDDSGFYYTRCPSGLSRTESRFHHRVYLHRLGDDWLADELVFGESLSREQSPFPQLSADGRYLVVVVQDLARRAPRSEVYVLDRHESARGFMQVETEIDEFVSAAIHRQTLYLRTEHEASMGKIMALKFAELFSGNHNYSTVINEGAYPIRNWKAISDYLFVETLEDVSSRLRMYHLGGDFIKQIELPEIGSISALTAAPESKELMISFSSFVDPRLTFRVDLESHKLNRVEGAKTEFDSEAFMCEQVWFTSRDHTRIPMFLVYKKGINRNGKNPAVIHGYGGFGVSMLPRFTAHVIPFLERGGIYAVVNARGGGEFGEPWHRAGMRENKQNTFDDFIAAGEYLIDNRYTAASRLGCFGWSNGGLSVNAVAIQRPDLWKAVVAGAPVTDMSRFDIAHGGHHWVSDYGSPQDKDDLEFLLRYSPYQLVPDNFDAPAILTIVPDNDDRVATWHGYKMHAAMSAANISDNPILLRREEDAGHRGSPEVGKMIDRFTDIWAFIFWQLGV